MPAIVTVEKAVGLAPRPGQRSKVALDPARAAHCTSPILALVEDWIAAPAAIAEHRHDGVEVVALVLAGSLEHKDSAGGSGALAAGDAQWITAGGGMLHSRAPREGEAHLVQLWVNLPAAHRRCGAKSRSFAAADIPVIEDGGARIRVVAGTHEGRTGPAVTFARVTCLDIALAPGASTRIELAGERGIAYVVGGCCAIAAATVHTGDVAFLDVRGQVPIEIDSERGGRVLLVAAPPLDEPPTPGAVIDGGRCGCVGV
jgi:redox-sensitive bicupin YhaK (pirin superfamily)